MGFDVDKFVSKVSEERKCSLCHLVLDNPVKTSCCHVFCSGCILPWVVRHGKCPHKCQTLTPKDLENILPLRETILNMHVRCNFLDRGCQAVVRLTDVEAHVQDCTFRPVQCPNRGCEEIVSYKDVSEHENTECSYRKVGVCKKGCDLELYFNSVENHDCLTALNDQIECKERKIYTLETEMKRLVSKFDKREKSLLVQLTNLRNELKSQAEYFQNKLCDYSHQIGLVKTDNEREDQVNLTIVLRKEDNTLGFNIMGGYTPENNNNEEKKEMDTSSSSDDGIIVSRLTDNGPAEKSGLLLEDRIIKVNGTDLSQSSHEEAVEAFRTAKEPIVVEVLRRVNKTKMKNRSPTMVSIGTQTEEDIYGYNRPPTPPPAIYPFHSSGLYQPSSRRPVAFSPSADMGLTDIEMAHALEYDDAYFEERAYDVEYEEVVLHRSSTSEKLGLTLCYGSLEDEMTDIFISEVDPCSIAAQDGRIREGDQILQINGIDVHSRDQAIKLFSEQTSNITLLLARPQLQLDDGFMEDQNVVLDDLHMDILEKHHHDNMQIMASMLARGHIDEEGGTTDTATTENSLHKHEKDSGVGRTDESTKNDESSEQETLDTECTNSPAATTKFRQCYNLNKHEQIYSDESFLSHDCSHDVIVNDIPSEECDKFREVLARRFSSGIENSPRNDSVRKDSRGSIEHELALLNKEMEQIQLECEEIVQSHLCEQNSSQKQRENTPYKSPRIVPRMGTRLEYLKHVQSYDNSEKDALMKQGQSSSQSEKDKDATSTSAYNTGESCRSTPLTLELNPASDEGEKGFKNSMLCLAPTASTMTPSLSDTEKQTQTPCSRSKDGSSDDNLLETSPGSLKDQGGMGESLQDLYVRYADVMYTNHANLQHTIAIQQKLFQQQLDQKPRYAGSPQPGSASSRSTVHQPDDFHAQGSPNMTPPDSSSQMEWVVKRRPDGTRYITRRPVRSKMLKERAKKISEERCGMTTDDDAMSELKTGRYWSKEDRKRHLEKAKDQKRRRELMMKAKMETLKETEEKKEVNIVELSHRKMNKRKGKKVLDNFVTVQEMMAHGSRVQDGKTYNPLLSVTTV